MSLIDRPYRFVGYCQIFDHGEQAKAVEAAALQGPAAQRQLHDDGFRRVRPRAGVRPIRDRGHSHHAAGSQSRRRRRRRLHLRDRRNQDRARQCTRPRARISVVVHDGRGVTARTTRARPRKIC